MVGGENPKSAPLVLVHDTGPVNPTNRPSLRDIPGCHIDAKWYFDTKVDNEPTLSNDR